MKQDGFTLIEALGALLVIGLAFGGMAQATRVIGLFHSSTTRLLNDDRMIRKVQNMVDGLHTGSGPFSSNRPKALSGDERAFSFDCVSSVKRCSAKLTTDGRGVALALTDANGNRRVRPLGAVRSARFEYLSQDYAGPVWPPASVSQAQNLAAIAILGTSGGSEVPLVVSHVWTEQEAECVFDAISGACRGTSP